MFPRRMPLMELRVSCIDLSLQAGSNVTLEDVAILAKCSPTGRDFIFESACLVCVSGAVSLSQTDVAFNIIYLRVVDLCIGLAVLRT